MSCSNVLPPIEEILSRFEKIGENTFARIIRSSFNTVANYDLNFIYERLLERERVYLSNLNRPKVIEDDPAIINDLNKLFQWMKCLPDIIVKNDYQDLCTMDEALAFIEFWNGYVQSITLVGFIFPNLLTEHLKSQNQLLR